MRFNLAQLQQRVCLARVVRVAKKVGCRPVETSGAGKIPEQPREISANRVRHRLADGVGEQGEDRVGSIQSHGGLGVVSLQHFEFGGTHGCQSLASWVPGRPILN